MTDPTSRTPVITVSSQQFLIALCVLTLAAAVVGVLGFVTVPKDNQTVLNVVIGNIMGIAGTVAAFYFPSSVGARAKDEAINKLTDQLTQPAHSPQQDPGATP